MERFSDLCFKVFIGVCACGMVVGAILNFGNVLVAYLSR